MQKKIYSGPAKKSYYPLIFSRHMGKLESVEPVYYDEEKGFYIYHATSLGLTILYLLQNKEAIVTLTGREKDISDFEKLLSDVIKEWDQEHTDPSLKI